MNSIEAVRYFGVSEEVIADATPEQLIEWDYQISGQNRDFEPITIEDAEDTIRNCQ